MGVSVSVTFLFTKYQSPSTKKTILYQRSLSRYYLIDNVLTWCVCTVRLQARLCNVIAPQLIIKIIASIPNWTKLKKDNVKELI